MKAIITAILLLISITVKPAFYIYLVGPEKSDFTGYLSYFKSTYKPVIIYSGTNIDQFAESYQGLLNKINNADTLIQIWCGHSGLTEDGSRGGACFILSHKTGKDIDQVNEIFGFNAIGLMCKKLTSYVRLVIIFDTCYAGLLVKSLKYEKITALMAVNEKQENFKFQDGAWFTKLFIRNITKHYSNAIITQINLDYLDKKKYNFQVPEYRKIKPVDYYPLRAVHFGNPFYFE